MHYDKDLIEYMKTLDFGSQLPSQGNFYIRLKEKGDQITFRLAQQPAYSGKHFMQTENGWDVSNCPRINNEEHCDTCDLYFKGMAESKKLKEASPEKAKETENEARKFKVAISFYFPVLDRGNEEFKIFQTTLGVRNRINELFESGFKIFDRDIVVRNTGSASPKDRYSVAPVDSADSNPLSEKEEEELKKAKLFDINEVNDGSITQDTLEE